MLAPWTESERGNLLRRRTVAQLQYEKAMQTAAQSPPWSEFEDDPLASAEDYLAAIEHAEHEYFERLPRQVVSCCPICHQPLVRTFDAFGLDGLWWRSDALPEEAAACRHFCVLLGAVGFGGRQVKAGSFEISPGPEVPYVVPRLLAHPSMCAVLSLIPMQPGYHAFPIAYFAENRPPSRELTAGWARHIHTYLTEDGREQWRIDNSEWDFDLRRWLEDRRLFWCPPHSGNSALSTDPPGKCPFLDLPGRRARMVVYGEQIVERGVPDGSPALC